MDAHNQTKIFMRNIYIIKLAFGEKVDKSMKALVVK